MKKPERSTETRIVYDTAPQSNDSISITSFSNTLTDSVIAGLRDVLTAKGTRGFLLHSRLRAHKIDPDSFHRNLSSLTGAGSEIIEKAIIQELFRKLGLPAEGKEKDFARCVNLARTILRTRAKEVDLI